MTELPSALPAFSITACVSKAQRCAIDRACRRDFSVILHFASSVETRIQVVSQLSIDLVVYVPEHF